MFQDIEGTLQFCGPLILRGPHKDPHRLLPNYTYTIDTNLIQDQMIKGQSNKILLISIYSTNKTLKFFILEEASNEINTCDKIFIGLSRNGSSWSWIDGDNQTYNNWDSGKNNA